MSGRKRWVCLIATAATWVLAAIPGTASGDVFLTPSTLDYGSQQVGTVSTPATFTVRVTCAPGVVDCNADDPFTPTIGISGEFAIQNNTCTTLMPGNTMEGTTCTFDALFIPLSPGVKTGTITTGRLSAMASLTGLGVAPPTGSGSTAPPVVTPPAGPTGQRAAALKKCSKKDGKARKRCRKRANRLPV
jgi:hypothetical protein